MNTEAATVKTPTVADFQKIMRENRWIFLLEGILFLIAGVLAIMLPLIASNILALFIGWMALVVGVLLLIRGGGVAGSEDRSSITITGMLFLILGLLVILWPWAGLEGLTLLMAIFCIIRGAMDLTGVPSRSSSTTGMQVICGIAGIVLGILLLVWYPEDAEWAPGLIFGIQLIFMGLGTFAVWNILSQPEASGLHSD